MLGNPNNDNSIQLNVDLSVLAAEKLHKALEGA